MVLCYRCNRLKSDAIGSGPIQTTNDNIVIA